MRNKIFFIYMPFLGSSREGERVPARDRCYDLLNIFAEKISKKWSFWLSTKLIMKKIDHNIGFREKRQICLPKIGENRRKLWS
jgi:hypothetical protein